MKSFILGLVSKLKEGGEGTGSSKCHGGTQGALSRRLLMEVTELRSAQQGADTHSYMLMC